MRNAHNIISGWHDWIAKLLATVIGLDSLSRKLRNRWSESVELE